MTAPKERTNVLPWGSSRFHKRGGDGVTGRRLHEGGALLHLDDYRTRERQKPPPAFAYCLASGTLGTAAATALCFTASGVTRFLLWSAVLAFVSAVAGLSYRSALVRAAWPTSHQWHPHPYRRPHRPRPAARRPRG